MIDRVDIHRLESAIVLLTTFGNGDGGVGGRGQNAHPLPLLYDDNHLGRSVGVGDGLGRCERLDDIVSGLSSLPPFSDRSRHGD